VRPASAAYKALVEKHSYSGPVTVFGKNYQGNYAPLTGADGKLNAALFVGGTQIAVLIVATGWALYYPCISHAPLNGLRSTWAAFLCMGVGLCRYRFLRIHAFWIFWGRTASAYFLFSGGSAGN
jgi:cache 3/cache 2 fusion protein